MRDFFSPQPTAAAGYLPQRECQHQLGPINKTYMLLQNNIVVQCDTIHVFNLLASFRELDETKELIRVDFGRSLAAIVVTDHTYRAKITNC